MTSLRTNETNPKFEFTVNSYISVELLQPIDSGPVASLNVSGTVNDSGQQSNFPVARPVQHAAAG